MDNQNAPGRNYGIDSLRMLSMFMVVVLHLLVRGGVVEQTQPLSPGCFAAWLLECGVYCAVNCYGLISGYVGYTGRFRYSRLAQFWLQIVFWTVAVTALFAVLRPESVAAENWLYAFFPILTGWYWYLSSYFGLFFLTPLLNRAVEHLTRGELRALLGAVLVFFCALPRLYSAHQAVDPFNLLGGYSVMWLALLYVAGAFLRKYDIPAALRPRTALLGYAGMVLLTWGSKSALELLAHRGIAPGVSSGVLLDYTSPTIVLASVFLVLFFARARYPRPVVKAVALLSPAALGVYVIHAHSLVWRYALDGCAASFALDRAPLMVGKTLALALGIYLFCSALELGRLRLFRLLRVEERCRRAEEKLTGRAP